MTLIELLDEDSFKLNNTNLHEIESLLSTPIIQHNLKEANIDPVIANMYIGDFYGLLHNIFKIPNIAFYINLRINNLYSSVEYDGAQNIRLLDPEIFENIYNYMEQKENI